MRSGRDGALLAGFGQVRRIRPRGLPEIDVGEGRVHAVPEGAVHALCGARVVWPVESGRQLWDFTVAGKCAQCVDAAERW